MMTALHDFHFLRPWWLLALFGLPLLLRALTGTGSAASAWRGVVDAHLLPYLLERGGGTGTRLPRALVGACWLVAVLALAGPAWERLPQPLFHNRAAHVIALELAPSMLARDLKPSRLERARFKISDLLRRLGDGQVALLAYAGDAFVVAPLTDDANTVANLLEPLDPSVMPVGGNNAASAIDRAVTLIHQSGLRSGDIILVADAVDASATEAAARAAAQGVRVSVLGVGTAQGAPVALPRGGFLQDSAGNIVIPKLQSAALQALASAGGGRYAALSVDGSDLDTVLATRAESAGAESAADAETDAAGARFQDRGPWLLLLLLPMCALGFRRGWLLLLPLILLLHAAPGNAMGWADLWQRADQQAAEKLKAGDAQQAAALARDPELRGAAGYRAGDFSHAADAFRAAPGAPAAYNLGNALAQQKRYEEAIAAYDRALALDPQLTDAAGNRQAVKDWLAQQQKNQDNKPDNNQDKDQNGGDKSDQQQGQSGADQQGGQSGEQQSGKGGQPGKNGKDDASAKSGQEGQPGKDGSAQNSDSQDKDSAQSAAARKAKESADERGKAGEDKTGADANGKNAGDSAPDADANSAAAGQDQDAASRAEAAQKQKEAYRRAMDQAVKQGDPANGAQAGAAQADDKSQDKSGRPVAVRDAPPATEQQQAMQQWLERIPDDPGGLLRRKFQLEHQRRLQGGNPEKPQ